MKCIITKRFNVIFHLGPANSKDNNQKKKLIVKVSQWRFDVIIIAASGRKVCVKRIEKYKKKIEDLEKDISEQNAKIKYFQSKRSKCAALLSVCRAELSSYQNTTTWLDGMFSGEANSSTAYTSMNMHFKVEIETLVRSVGFREHRISQLD